MKKLIPWLQTSDKEQPRSLTRRVSSSRNSKGSVRQVMLNSMSVWSDDLFEKEITDGERATLEFFRSLPARVGRHDPLYGLYMSLENKAIWLVQANGSRAIIQATLDNLYRHFVTDRELRRYLGTIDEGYKRPFPQVRKLVTASFMAILFNQFETSREIFDEIIVATKSTEEYVLDKEVIAILSFLQSLLANEAAAINEDNFGFYYSFVEKIVTDGLTSDFADEFISKRNELAANCYLEKSDVSIGYFGDLFAATYPIEIIAALKVYENAHGGSKIELSDELSSSLYTLSAAEETSFIKEIRGILAQLKSKMGQSS